MQTGEGPKSISRELVVIRARSYVGSPFVHQGRQLGRGIDCVGLVLCVAEDLGLRDSAGVPFLRGDYVSYSAQPVDRFVHEECIKRLTVKAPLDELLAGDVLSMRVPHLPTHLAIIAIRSGVQYVIHAYNGNGKVVEHVLSEPWRRRIVGSFSFPEVA
jgi:NlpC/P60 family putative phage cell wall peptidase